MTLETLAALLDSSFDHLFVYNVDQCVEATLRQYYPEYARHDAEVLEWLYRYGHFVGAYTDYTPHYSDWLSRFIVFNVDGAIVRYEYMYHA